jgi:hypothetical protein
VKRLDTFAVIMLVALSQANLCQVLWTVWLTLEQIETGWGGGTGMEMLALLPWMAELASVPVLIAGVVYGIMSCFRKQNKGLLVANVALFVLLLGQIVTINLFLFY